MVQGAGIGALQHIALCTLGLQRIKGRTQLTTIVVGQIDGQCLTGIHDVAVDVLAADEGIFPAEGGQDRDVRRIGAGDQIADAPAPAGHRRIGRRRRLPVGRLIRMRIQLRWQRRVAVQVLVLGDRPYQRAGVGHDRQRAAGLIEQGRQLRHLRVQRVLDAVTRRSAEIGQWMQLGAVQRQLRAHATGPIETVEGGLGVGRDSVETVVASIEKDAHQRLVIREHIVRLQ